MNNILTCTNDIFAFRSSGYGRCQNLSTDQTRKKVQVAGTAAVGMRHVKGVRRAACGVLRAGLLAIAWSLFSSLPMPVRGNKVLTMRFARICQRGLPCGESTLLGTFL